VNIIWLRSEIPTGRYFRYVWSVFGICNTDVGIGSGIWKYRDIGSVSVLHTPIVDMPYVEKLTQWKWSKKLLSMSENMARASRYRGIGLTVLVLTLDSLYLNCSRQTLTDWSTDWPRSTIGTRHTRPMALFWVSSQTIHVTITQNSPHTVQHSPFLVSRTYVRIILLNKVTNS